MYYSRLGGAFMGRLARREDAHALVSRWPFGPLARARGSYNHGPPDLLVKKVAAYMP